MKDDCWCIDALYKLKPNKVHSKEVQYVKVHHEEVHHKEVHHEEVQIKLQQIHSVEHSQAENDNKEWAISRQRLTPGPSPFGPLELL